MTNYISITDLALSTDPIVKPGMNPKVKRTLIGIAAVIGVGLGTLGLNYHLEDKYTLKAEFDQEITRAENEREQLSGKISTNTETTNEAFRQIVSLYIQDHQNSQDIEALYTLNSKREEGIEEVINNIRQLENKLEQLQSTTTTRPITITSQDQSPFISQCEKTFHNMYEKGYCPTQQEVKTIKAGCNAEIASLEAIAADYSIHTGKKFIPQNVENPLISRCQAINSYWNSENYSPNNQQITNLRGICSEEIGHLKNLVTKGLANIEFKNCR